MKHSHPAKWGRYLLKRLGKPQPPKTVEVETTSYCNRKCAYCPNATIGRPEDLMDERLFHRIIDSLAQWDFTGRFSPHFYGEPLTDERLVGFMAHARKKLPKANIVVYTNGDYLTVDKYIALMEAGVDSFRVSLHSPSLPKAFAATQAFLQERRPELYKVEIVDFYGMYKSKEESMLNNRGGMIDITHKRHPYCFLVEHLTIDYLGNAVLCCNDFLSSVTFGNAGEKELKDIWYDPAYVEARRRIASGFWLYDICQKCNL